MENIFDMNFRIEKWPTWIIGQPIIAFSSNVPKASMKLHMSYNTVQLSRHILQKQTRFYEMFTSVTIFSFWRIEISWNRWASKQNRKFIETLAAGWPHSDLSEAGIFVCKYVCYSDIVTRKSKILTKFSLFVNKDT